MPTGQHWAYFIFVNVAFAIYISCVFYYGQLATVKANWPLYRCNPMYMYLAEDLEENFTYCIQTMQSNYMGHILQPLTFVTSALTTSMGGIANDLQNVRAMFFKIRTFFSSTIQSIFGVFLNLVIEFQKITIGIRDLVGKTIGIMVSLMYVLDGSVKTMNSTWNGPPGQLIRSLGKCFSPETRVMLQTGESKAMKELALGDILSDGSVVQAILHIDNRRDRIPFYSIETGSEPILVTGSHLVLDPSTGQFIPVAKYSRARQTTQVSDTFSCLITDTHHIPLSGELFWDWEDHFVKMGREKENTIVSIVNRFFCAGTV